MKDFEEINWLQVSERFNRSLCSKAFKFLRKPVPYFFLIYMCIYKYDIYI